RHRIILLCVFFFSRRRRHTRFSRDWSSDVCSSDLLVANAIHQASNCTGAFVAWNCGAASRELIGSELFGHEKGAFTGAIARKEGLFEQADKGTLFLDEITEMPIDMQPNLLRVLETQRVTRVGGTQEINVNCRVISATNRTTEQL